MPDLSLMFLICLFLIKIKRVTAGLEQGCPGWIFFYTLVSGGTFTRDSGVAMKVEPNVTVFSAKICTSQVRNGS